MFFLKIFQEGGVISDPKKYIVIFGNMQMVQTRLYYFFLGCVRASKVPQTTS